MKTSAAFKDFKELGKKLGNNRSPAFDLDNDDPELDIATWVSVKMPSGSQKYTKLGAGEMSIRFSVTSAYRKKFNIAPDAIIEAQQMYIRFGAKVIKNCGWRAGETVGVYQHPQDKSVYALMPKSSGLKIRAEGKNTTLYLSFAFPNELKYLTHKSKIVEFSVHENGYLLFRLPPKEKE